jgi:2-C-methyl-D-erythritol 4-phosphate cytidylyltransferase
VRDLATFLKIAIVVAAGSGSRMRGSDESGQFIGFDLPKVLLPLGEGEAVVAKAVQAFLSAEIARIIVVINPCYSPHFVEALARWSDRIEFVSGGDTRQESVQRGVAYLKDVDDRALVAVHDAARCLCTSDLVRRCFDGAFEHDAVTAAVPMVDTVALADSFSLNSWSFKEPLPREQIWQIQTPQVFRLGLLRRAHDEFLTECRTVSGKGSPVAIPTDDASMVARFHTVVLVRGERHNFKLTTPDDYRLACCLMESYRK